MAIDLQYLGWAGFKMINKEGKKLLIDPWIQNNRFCSVPMEDVLDADVIAVTHGTLDHCGDSFEIAKKTGATIICGIETAIYAERMGVPKKQIKRIVYGSEYEGNGYRIKSLYAQHPSVFEVGDTVYSGFAMSYMIWPDSDSRPIFHSGDTALFSDLKLYQELFNPYLGLLNISGMNGHNKEMTPQELGLMVKWLGVETAVPMHYEADSPDIKAFEETVKLNAPGTTVNVMKPSSWQSF